MPTIYATEQLREWLASSKGDERTRASKAIGRQNCVELGPELFAALQIEMQRVASWERQCDMMHALGLLRYKPGRTYFAGLVKQKDVLYGMVYFRAIQAYILTADNEKESMLELVHLLGTGDLLTMDACAELLQDGHLLPKPEEIPPLLELMVSRAPIIAAEYTQGISDPRMHLLHCIPLWKKKKLLANNKEAVQQYIAHCLEYPHLVVWAEQYAG